MENLIAIDEFITAIATATANCYLDLLALNPDASVYGFALYTVDDLAGIVPSASSEAGFNSHRERILSDDVRLAWLREHDIDVEAFILGDYRWSIYEWEYECHGYQFYDQADWMLAAAVDRLRSNDLPHGFTQLTGEVLASFTIALRRLRNNGVFSNAASSIMLFCSTPSSDAVWLERESARLLNAPEMFEVFQRERVRYIQDSGYENPSALPVYQEILLRYG